MLYNHKAKKLAIDKPFFNQWSYSVLDKWHYNFALFGDGTAIFNSANEGKGNEAGVMDWLAFSVESSNDGQFIVSKASNNQMAILKPAFAKINTNFIRVVLTDKILMIY
jgi:hypothetical protein